MRTQGLTTVRSVLTIAGSDSGGGAGIQADLRTFAAFGLHGLSVICAITAQNTRRVTSIHCVPALEVERQLEAVFEDFDIGAVKIGMLGSCANVTAVAKFLRHRHVCNVVVDPVLVASSGRRLLPARGISLLRTRLLPLAELVTPNQPEAVALLGRELDGRASARALLALGPRSALVKGGHGTGRAVRDYLATASDASLRVFRHRRLPIHAHGTGCVLSAAIAAGLALGQPLGTAVAAAQSYLQAALRRSYVGGSDSIRLLPAAPFNE
jgi:hydroxymethylpyrimidine/phosphomethylpyrimidine kinase